MKLLQWIQYMPSPQLRVIEPCPVIVPIQIKLILQFLAVVEVFVGGVSIGGGNAGHEHAEGVVAILLLYVLVLVQHHTGATEMIF